LVNNLIQNIIPNETIINIIDEITHHFGCRWISLEIKRIAVDQLDPTGQDTGFRNKLADITAYSRQEKEPRH